MALQARWKINFAASDEPKGTASLRRVGACSRDRAMPLVQRYLSRPPPPHLPGRRRGEELGRTNPQRGRDPHERLDREVLHAALDELVALQGQVEPLRRLLLGQAASVTDLADPPADVAHDLLGILVCHPRTVRRLVG
jgi:hypothetical protein